MSAQLTSSAPELVLQNSHTDRIRAIAFSPDGRVLASASEDHTVKLWETATGLEIRTLTGHTDTVEAVAFSQDGRWLATASLADSTIKIWDATSGIEFRTLQRKQRIPGLLALAFGPKSEWLAFLEGDGRTLVMWDFVQNKVLHSVSLPKMDTNLSSSFSGDAQLLCQGGIRGNWRVWDVVTGQEVRTFEGDTTSAKGKLFGAMAISPDRRRIASGGFGGSINVWEVSTGREVNSLKEHAPSGNGIAFSPDGDRLVSTVDNHSLLIWDVASGREVKTLTNPAERFDLVVFSPNGKLLASTTDDDTVEFWDISTGIERHTLSTQFASINSVRVSPDLHWLASASGDSDWKTRMNKRSSDVTHVWDLITGRQVHDLPNRSNDVNALAFSPDSRWLVSGGGDPYLPDGQGDNHIRFWDVATGTELRTLSGHTKAVRALAYSPDGRQIASGSEDMTVKLWNPATGDEVGTLKGHYFHITSLGFSTDSRWVAAVAAGTGSGVKLWETSTKRELSESFTNQSDGDSVAFSPDGRWVAFDDFKGIRIWNLASKQELRTITENKGMANPAHSLAFSHDGRWLAAAGSFPRDPRDDSARIWDVESGRLIHTLTGHTYTVNDVTFSPDGRWLATASNDGTVRIWDSKSGGLRITLLSTGDEGWLAVAPDGLFDGTADAMQRVTWKDTNSLRVASLDSFFSDFYYPGLLAEVLKDNPPHADLDIGTALQIPGLRTLLSEKLAHIETHGGKLILCFEQMPGTEVQVPVGFGVETPMETNGYRVVPTDPTCKYQKDIPAEGTMVTKLQNWKPELFVTPYDGKPSDTRKSVLHVLSVGVAEYRADSGFDRLPYAVPSAKALEDYFTEQEAKSEKPFAQVRVWPGLYDASASRQSIHNRLSEMAKEMTEDDVVLLYFVGHGVVAHGTEMFYYVPSDGKYADIRATGINTAMLAEALRDMPARRIVLVIDACQSGGAIEALGKIGEVKARVEQERAQAETQHNHAAGVHIIAATLPFSYAIGFKTGQSALASTLLNALRQPGLVSVNAVVEYLKKQLPESSRKGIDFSQVPLARSIGLDFAIAAN